MIELPLEVVHPLGRNLPDLADIVDIEAFIRFDVKHSIWEFWRARKSPVFFDRQIVSLLPN